MKQLYTLFTLVAAGCLCASASDFKVGNLEYNIVSEEDATVEIAEPDEEYEYLSADDLVSQVEYEGVTYTVVGIESYAFYYTEFTDDDVALPSTIKYIGSMAFDSAEVDGTLTLPASLEQIGGLVFAGSYMGAFEVPEENTVFASVDGLLTSKDKTLLLAFPSIKDTEVYEFPECITKINDGACYGGQLFVEEFVFGPNITEIGQSAFYECANLTTIKVPGTVTLNQSSFAGCEGCTTLEIGEGIETIPRLCFFDLDALETLVIPNSVKEVGKQAFGYCGLTSITFSSSMTEIPENAFADCYQLEEVALPANIKELGTNCFARTPLVSIDLGGVETIGEFAFSQCSSLSQITGCDNVTSIGRSAFYYCESLVDFPSMPKLKSITNNALMGCTALESLTIPASVEEIECGFTCRTFALKEINVEDGNQNFAAVDGILYDKDLTRLVSYPSGHEAETLALPATVSLIDQFSLRNGAFKVFTSNGGDLATLENMAMLDCTNMEELVLGDKVATINTTSFNNCNALVSVTSLNPTPPQTVNFTATAYANSTLYVISEAAKAAYEADANWSKFASIMVIADGVDDIANAGDVVETTYFNMQGVASPTPFEGSVNIVRNRYNNGTVKMSKAIYK